MPVIIDGEIEGIPRVITGFHTFDRAFENRRGEIGFPVKALCEVYGQTGVGKSTFSYFLASKIATHFGGHIALADTELFDPQTMKDMLEFAGFDGKVKLAKGEKDGDLVDDLIAIMRSDDYVVGILDSLGAISPVSEVESSSEAANMGNRARLAARLARKAVYTFRQKEKPSIIIFTNHQLPIIGFGKGVTTSGGMVKGFLSGTQIRLTRKEEIDESYLLQGIVVKNRFGYSKRKFFLFSLAGYGIHLGLTAVKECLMLGIASEKRIIKLGDTNYGYFKKMIENCDDDDLFVPFIEALKNNRESLVAESIEESEDSEE